MSRAEGIQYAFPEIYDLPEVWVPVKREKLNPFLVVSRSILEQCGSLLDHPDEDPKALKAKVIERQIPIQRGITLHEIIQTTQLWRWALPKETRDYKTNYFRNLYRIGELVPTTKMPQIRRLIHHLNDERLAMRKTWDNTSYNARQACYQIMADRVLEYTRKLQPFTHTRPMQPLFGDDQPVIDPIEFCQAWDTSNQNRRIKDQVQNLFCHHESKGVLPVESMSKYGGFASEVRVNCIDPKTRLIWSVRLDELQVTKPDPLTTQYHIIDYKSSMPKITPGTNEWEAHMLSTWLTVSSLIHLDEIEANGKAIQLRSSFEKAPPTKVFKMTYLSYQHNPPDEWALHEDCDRYWTHRKDYIEMKQRYYDFIDLIRQNEARLAPIIGPISGVGGRVPGLANFGVYDQNETA